MGDFNDALPDLLGIEWCENLTGQGYSMSEPKSCLRGLMFGLPLAIALWVLFWKALAWAVVGVRAWL
jgi:hypothetical protein